MKNPVFADRKATWAFVLGCLAVTVGVVMHLPMFLMARDMGYMLVGMPMGGDMVGGMGLIIGGTLLAGWGLLPRKLQAAQQPAQAPGLAMPDDAPLGRPQLLLLLVLSLALVIDTMKPASLGFTVPGMAREYMAPARTVSLVPFFALIGTTVGSIVWGVLADLYGRKATILLSAVMFVGTSICGAMPSLAWNIGMCFMMGAAAGGMLPVTYALLAEMMPARHRGWSLVLVGGIGALGGYFVASGASALLLPHFGWRILWLLNLPTGLVLIFISRAIPESAKFLLAQGREAEARAVLARFGGKLAARADRPAPVAAPEPASRLQAPLIVLTLVGLCWGLANFGLLLWLPKALVDKGMPMELASRILAQSAFIALPTILGVAVLYGFWSTKSTLLLSIGTTVAGLAGIIAIDRVGTAGLIPAISLLLVGINALIAILLPYAAELFPLRIRARSTGVIAASTKGGGVLAQALFIAGMAPRIETLALAIASILAVSGLLVAAICIDTRKAPPVLQPSPQ